MQVELYGQHLRIRFAHYHGQIGSGDGTACWIDRRDPVQDGERPTWTIVAAGAACCNPCDQYRKEVGRKLALGRALRNGEFDKAARGLFWAAYHNRFAASVLERSRMVAV